jgi:CRISPR-associated protein Csm2
MPSLTAANIVAEIKGRNATLSQIIHLDDFAERDMLADELAREFRGELKPTQLRKVFDSIKDIARSLKGRKASEALTSEDRSQILPLLPTLAYARGRDLIPQKFYDLMSLALSSSKMKTVEDFQRLDQFLTAILAYQKFYEKGGR